jgi:hypothetical protein
MVGAIGQPDLRLGEVPCAYVELISGSNTDSAELMSHIQEKLNDKLAMPVNIEILEELPKTPVGKIFKPDLRKKAIIRVFDAELKANNIDARVVDVVEDKIVGLTALVEPSSGMKDDEINQALGEFIVPWKFN